MGYLQVTEQTSTEFSETNYDYYTTEHDIATEEQNYEMDTIQATQQEQSFTQ